MKKTGKLCRILSVILSAALAVSSVGALPLSAAENDNFYRIKTAAELIEFSKLCRLDSWSMDKNVVLENDIVLTGIDFSPIPIFCGSFDGQGHSIRGISITGVNGRGLFNIVEKNAIVKNLSVVGLFHPTGSETGIGSIAGTNNGTISDCSFSGRVTAAEKVGGIVGDNSSTGSVINCRSAGTIDGKMFIGGIAGCNAGNIVQCVNSASVNTTNEEKAHSLEDIGLSALTDAENRSPKIESSSATDIGGITGYSTGTILTCENNGSIGYPHVGYNIGGITGRSSGLISNCVNNGHINGRKDIGGIAGQMEPYIVINIDPDNLAKLKEELKTLSDLINTTINDTKDDSLGINVSVKNASGYLQSATESTDNIQQKLTEYGEHITSEFDRTSAVVSDAIARLDKITGIAPEASENLSTGTDRLSIAFDKLAGTQKFTDDSVERLKELSEMIKASAKKSTEAYENIDEGLKAIADAVHSSALSSSYNMIDSVEQIRTGLYELSVANDCLSKAIKEIASILSAADEFPANVYHGLSDLSDSISLISDALNNIADGAEGLLDDITIDTDGILDGLIGVSDGFSTLCDAIEKMSDSDKSITAILKNTNETGSELTSSFGVFSDAFDSFTKTTDTLTEISYEISELFDFLSSVETVELGNPDESIKNDTENLFASLTSFIDEVNTLNVKASDAGVTLSENLVKINEQTYAISDLITDMLDIDNDEDYIKDTSDVDYDKIESGKVYRSENRGTICGDLNVGGIAGQVAVEYDFDPEDDIASDGNSPLKKKLETKAAAIKNSNYGEITAKKNCAGGIAGQMNLGLLKGCASFGKISSENGDYVGGISGKSSSKITSCYAKGILSGRNYIGGIAGSAGTVQECYSLVDITERQSYFGAISGSSEGEFSENYFVSDELCGLDGASYKGIAEPIPYHILMLIPVIPKEFRNFSLYFIADGKQIDKADFSYGDSFDENGLPDIPSKDDCYAKWDHGSLEDLHVDKEIYAEYFNVISTLSSTNSSENGKPIWLAEGIFTEEDLLSAEQSNYESQITPELFYVEKQELCENWTLTVPNDSSESHTFRYLINSESRHSPDIYVRNNSKWEKVETRSIGSYLCFTAAGNFPEILVVYRTLNITLIAVISAATALVILIVILTIKVVKKRKIASKTAAIK